MIRDDSGSEELLLGMGAILASAVLLLVVFSLFRSTLPADRSVALQSSASVVSGDIASVASSSIPFSHCEHYQFNGITVSVSSDYVTAQDTSGRCFAKPLPVRACPGCYSCGSVSWDNTAGFRSFVNATFGAEGSEQHPVDAADASDFCDLLSAACQYLVVSPLVVDPSKPLYIEKQLFYFENRSSRSTECIPCVFVYQ